MSACATLRVTREAALAALARRELGHLTDEQISEKLNGHLAEGHREPLLEVHVADFMASTRDMDELRAHTQKWEKA